MVHAAVYTVPKVVRKGLVFMNIVCEGIDPTNERQQNGERYSVTLFERQACAVRTSAHGSAYHTIIQLQCMYRYDINPSHAY